MIIGIDASRANRRHKSGTEWYSYYLIRALARLDSRNQYILYTDTPLRDGLADLTEEGEKHPLMPSIHVDGTQELKSPHGNFSAKVLGWRWRFLWSQGRLSLEMLFKRPDVLFVPAHALPLIHPRRSIVTIHDIGFCRDGSLYGRQRIGTDSRRSHRFLNGLVRVLSRGRYGANTFDYLDWSTRFALNNAHKVIAISDFTKQELIEIYNARSERISVVHNGYNTELYKPITDHSVIENVLIRYGIKTPYLFYVGRLEKKKNIAALIEAFALLKQKRGAGFDCTLCLAGDASFGFDEVKYSINEYGLERDIITTGWVQEKDLPALFGGAAGFVFPSNYEGFGIPLLQAMAMGTPIAASNIASIPEIAGDAAVLFDPSDPSDMAVALEHLLYDTKLRERLISAGYERVRLFDWERAAVSTLAVLES